MAIVTENVRSRYDLKTVSPFHYHVEDSSRICLESYLYRTIFSLKSTSYENLLLSYRFVTEIFQPYTYIYIASYALGNAVIFIHILVMELFSIIRFNEGKIQGRRKVTGRKGRRRKQLFYNLKETEDSGN